MEEAVGPYRAEGLLHWAGVGELAVEEADAVFARLVALARPCGVAALDDIEDPSRHERLEVLHARAPAVGAEDGDPGVLGEDVFGEVAAREPGDTGDEDPHSRETLARAVPARLPAFDHSPVFRHSPRLDARRSYPSVTSLLPIRHTPCGLPRRRKASTVEYGRG